MLTDSLKQLDTINEVENWKSTVDPNTGRTYWYHRKTRESSWIKPSCLEALEKLTSDIQQNTSSTYVSESFISADEDNDESAVNFGEIHMDRTSHYEDHENRVGNRSGYEGADGDGYDLLLEILNRLDFSLTPESVVNDLTSKVFATKLKALQNLCSCCNETTAGIWIMFPDCLASICDIMMIPSSLSSTSSKYTKTNIANNIQCGRLAAYIFSQICATGSTWDYLFAHSAQWLLTPTSFEHITDTTIGYMIAYSYCFLSESNSIISLLISENELLECISQWVAKHTFDVAERRGRLLETIDLASLNYNLPCIDSKSLLSLYHISNQSGILLPLFVILGYCNACVNRCIQADQYSTTQNEQNQKYVHDLVQCGAINVLLQLVINTTILIDANARSLAKAVIAQLMTFSPTVCTDILDNYCALSKQMQNIPACSMDAQVMSDAAQVDMQDERYYDMLVKEYQQTITSTPVHRDVEWKPSGDGRAYRLSSVVLWSRCPSLRAILADFWEETDGSGGLELSLDASEAVLACVCEYVHTNILLMPPLLYPDQLDVIRVAQQLNMTGLIHDSIEFVAQGSMASNRELIEQYARTNRLMSLVAKCEDFSQGLVEDNIVVDLRLNNSGSASKTVAALSGPDNSEGQQNKLAVVTVSVATNTDPMLPVAGSTSTTATVDQCIDLEAELMRPSTNPSSNSTSSRTGGRQAQGGKTGKSGEIYRLLLQQQGSDFDYDDNGDAVQSSGEIDLSAYTATASGREALSTARGKSSAAVINGAGISTTAGTRSGQGRIPGAQAMSKGGLGDNVFSVAKASAPKTATAGTGDRGSKSAGVGTTGNIGKSGDGTVYSASGKPLKVHPMMEQRMQEAQAQRSMAQGQAQRPQLHQPDKFKNQNSASNIVKPLNLDDIENELLEMGGLEDQLSHRKGQRQGHGGHQTAKFEHDSQHQYQYQYQDEHDEGGGENDIDEDEYDRQQLHDLSVSVDTSIVLEYDDSMSLLHHQTPPEKKLTPAERRLAKTSVGNNSINSNHSNTNNNSKNNDDIEDAPVTTKPTAKRSKYSLTGQVIAPKKPVAATNSSNSSSTTTVTHPPWNSVSDDRDHKQMNADGDSYVDPDMSAVFIAEDKGQGLGHGGFRDFDDGEGRDQHLPSTRMASSPVLSMQNPQAQVQTNAVDVPNSSTSTSANGNFSAVRSTVSPTPDANIRSSLTLLKKRVTRRNSVTAATITDSGATSSSDGGGNGSSASMTGSSRPVSSYNDYNSYQNVESRRGDNNSASNMRESSESLTGRSVSVPVTQPNSYSRSNTGSNNNNTRCLRNQSCRCPSCVGAMQSSELIRDTGQQRRSQFDLSDSERDREEEPEGRGYGEEEEEEAMFEKSDNYSGRRGNVGSKSGNTVAGRGIGSGAAATGRGSSSVVGNTGTVSNRSSNTAGASNHFDDQLPAVALGSGSGSGYSSVDNALPEYDPDYVAPSEQCPQCSRKFTPAAFSKHVKICAKVFMQKRKTFDASEKRKVEDETAVPVYGKKKPASAIQTSKTKKGADNGRSAAGGSGGGATTIPKWKLESLQFRQAMKAANGGGDSVSGGLGGGSGIDPESEEINRQLAKIASDSLIPCPHCGRRFNEKAAERHIPKCQDIRAKPTFLSKNSNLGIGSKTPNRNVNAGGNNNSRFVSKQTSSSTTSTTPGTKYKIGNSNESSTFG